MTSPPGKPITYTVTVRNGGPGAAAAVHLVDVLPAYTTFVSVTVTRRRRPCTTPGVGSTETMTCNRTSLASGTTSTLTLVVKLNGGGEPGHTDCR